jgi:adenosylmethionine-8-amino-7-oxononanoate transaminase
MNAVAKLDHRYVWHPFTQMADWVKHEPIVITEGKGSVLKDMNGKSYLDGNSSIWTNLHGHAHPKINGAIKRQLGRISHSSALGLASEPASKLAEQLIRATHSKNSSNSIKNPVPLAKVFFSDDGSTAMEAALKMAHQFTQRTAGQSKSRFLSLDNAYHGDTLGAVSLGQIDLFHRPFKSLTFKTEKTPAPYCYRCPHNRAKPDRVDARESRKCSWECLNELEKKFRTAKRSSRPYSAFVFEPLIQGAAGMIAHPSDWLRQSAQIARAHGALLIADEVLTGFGRTGSKNHKTDRRSPRLFACQAESVHPDFMALAKGLTGGCLPMGATLTTQRVFDAFLGKYEDFRTFFHGPSYSGNQLGSAAALSSLELLNSPRSLQQRSRLEDVLSTELKDLWSLSNVGDVRQAGLIAGVELVKEITTRKPFALREKAGIKVCEAMARKGVLTRPIGNVIVLMPPYCTTPRQVRKMIQALKESVREVHGD